MLVDNPWQVRSIQAFSCLKCPECAFITKEENTFQTHAVQSHPLSYVGYASIFFGRLSSNSEILSPKSYRLSSNSERLSSNSERLSSNEERLSSNDERLSSNGESQKEKDEKHDNIKEHSIKGKNIINVYSNSYRKKSSEIRHVSNASEETNSSQVNKTNEVANNLQESGISDDMIEIKNEPLDEPIEQDPLQMGHTVTDTVGHPVTNTMRYPVIDSMGHPVIASMGHPTNVPIKQDPLQIETDTMRHPANMPVIKLQMGRPVTEAMRHPVTETMGHPVIETMENPTTDSMGYPTNLPKIETETLNENMNTTSIPYHTFDNSSVKKRNKKRGYPFYVVCNPPKKNATMNYSLSDAPVIQAHDKMYKCYECDTGFPDIETFNKHYESAHEWGKP